MRDEFIRVLKEVSKPEQISTWAKLGYQLTISARGAYPEDNAWKDSDYEAMRCVNELNHRVFGRLLELASEVRDNDASTNDSLIDVLHELSTNGHKELLERALRTVIAEG